MFSDLMTSSTTVKYNNNNNNNNNDSGQRLRTKEGTLQH